MLRMELPGRPRGRLKMEVAREEMKSVGLKGLKEVEVSWFESGCR